MNKYYQRQIEELLNQAKYEEALDIVQHMEQIENLPPDDNLRCLLVKTEILIGKGEFEKALSLNESTLVESRELGNLLLETDAFILQADVLEKLRKHDESLKLINQGEQNLSILRDLHPTEFNRRRAEVLYLKGRNLWQKYDPERALIPLSASLTLFEELGNKQRIRE